MFFANSQLRTILIGLALPTIVSATPTVSNVTAKQRYPWNGMVDITCTVSGIGETAGRFEFAVAAVNSGNVHDISQFWVVKDGTNSTNHAVRTNGIYHLIWDSKIDFDNQVCSNIVMRVNIVREKVQLWANGPYWATTNIGAEEPWVSGYYFWWGDVIGCKFVNNAWMASNGSWVNVPFGSFGSDNVPTSGKDVATLKNEGWITADCVLASAHDAAQVHWGGAWRMPTDQELAALINNCDWTFTSMNGYGYVVRGRGDYASNSIFLPAAHYVTGASLENSRPNGYYWSSVPYSADSCAAWFLHSDYSGWHRTSYLTRCYGLPVHPVQGHTK